MYMYTYMYMYSQTLLMGKKKSFTSEALSTITGAPKKATSKAGPQKQTSIPSNTEKPKKEVKVKPQPIVSRNTKRTGKPVTLYLNTENYKLFKAKAKQQDKTASLLMNEFMVSYISEDL